MEEYRAKLRQARNENLRLINFNYHVTRNTGTINLLTYIFDSDLVCRMQLMVELKVVCVGNF